jgi:hypothetical protein
MQRLAADGVLNYIGTGMKLTHIEKRLRIEDGALYISKESKKKQGSGPVVDECLANHQLLRRTAEEQGRLCDFDARFVVKTNMR